MKTGTMSPELLARVMHPWEQALPSACHFPIAPIQRNGLSSSKRKSPPLEEEKRAKPRKTIRIRGDNLRLEIKRFLAWAIHIECMWGPEAILRSFFLLQKLKSFSLQRCWHIADVRLGLGQDGWRSLLIQTAGTKAKHRAQPQHLWSFFLLYYWTTN